MISAKRLIVMASVLPFLSVAGTGSVLAAGALAFGQNSQTRGWSSGFSYNYTTQEEASNWAMSRCREREAGGSYCKIIATVRGRCLAIAVQDGGNGYGWNTAESLQEAQRLAVDRCRSFGKSCSVRDGFCDITTSSSTPSPAPAPAPSGPTPGGNSPACQKFPNLC